MAATRFFLRRLYPRIDPTAPDTNTALQEHENRTPTPRSRSEAIGGLYRANWTFRPLRITSPAKSHHKGPIACMPYRVSSMRFWGHQKPVARGDVGASYPQVLGGSGFLLVRDRAGKKSYAINRLKGAEGGARTPLQNLIQE